MGLYGGKDGEIVPEERLKVLLKNAISIYAEAHSDRYNSSEEFKGHLYDELGTDEAEIRELGIDLSDVL